MSSLLFRRFTSAYALREVDPPPGYKPGGYANRGWIAGVERGSAAHAHRRQDRRNWSVSPVAVMRPHALS